jgi:hypothetical protein
LAGSAKSQFLQFTAPGGPEARPETTQERLEREIRQAPLRLGPARIAPLVGFRDVAYVRDLFDSGDDVRSDVTATVGAGFRAYLRTGGKVTWIAQLLPEYVWWKERADARRLNLSSGLEAVFLLNHLTLDVAASRVEQQKIVTPEVPELVAAASDLGRLDAELKLSEQLRPFVSARWARQEGLVDDRDDDPRIQQVELLDRDEKVVRAGLHWYPRRSWMIGLGVERSQTDFDRPTLDSSNQGTSPIFLLSVDRPHFFASADLAARSLTATAGSRFVDYDGITGSISLNLVPRSELEVWLYANRELLYSLSTDYPYLQDQRTGLSLGTGIGARVYFRAFAETGDEEYTRLAPGVAGRTDDLTAYGGSLRFTITETLSFSLQATHLELDSNIAGSDRSYTSGGLSLSLRGNLAGRNL